MDITGNRDGFEYSVSSDLLAKSKEVGIGLASNEVLRPKTNADFADLFNSHEFNILLLMTHGGEEQADGSGSAVLSPGGETDWYRLAGLTSKLRENMICLAVCHGVCADTLDSFLGEDQFALILVGSKAELDAREVLDFFPSFFAELKKSTIDSIDPNEVRRCVNAWNHLANGKMHVYSDALSWSRQELEYAACHEAGHAVARTVNGDVILYVAACARITAFRGKDWTCGCGGRFNPQSDRFTCNFNPDCDACTAFVKSQVCANYSGRAATAEVMPDCLDTQEAEYDDDVAAEEFAKAYSSHPEKWQHVKLAARRLAGQLAARESKAILELRDALVRAGGWLDGLDVQRIIKANLAGRSAD
jgi:hypothetical protein